MELHGTRVEKDRVGEGMNQTVVGVENGNFSENRNLWQLLRTFLGKGSLENLRFLMDWSINWVGGVSRVH